MQNEDKSAHTGERGPNCGPALALSVSAFVAGEEGFCQTKPFNGCCQTGFHRSDLSGQQYATGLLRKRSRRLRPWARTHITGTARASWRLPLVQRDVAMRADEPITAQHGGFATQSIIEIDHRPVFFDHYARCEFGRGKRAI